MESILESLQVFMMIGIVLIIGISQFNRFWGSVLGIIFWLAVAAVGSIGYAQGGSLGILNYKLSPAVFYGLCLLLLSFNAAQLYVVKNAKRRAAMRQAVIDAEED